MMTDKRNRSANDRDRVLSEGKYNDEDDDDCLPPVVCRSSSSNVSNITACSTEHTQDSLSRDMIFNVVDMLNLLAIPEDDSDRMPFDELINMLEKDDDDARSQISVALCQKISTVIDHLPTRNGKKVINPSVYKEENVLGRFIHPSPRLCVFYTQLALTDIDKLCR